MVDLRVTPNIFALDEARELLVVDPVGGGKVDIGQAAVSSSWAVVHLLPERAKQLVAYTAAYRSSSAPNRRVRE